MFSRKQPVATTPWIDKGKHSKTKEMNHPSIVHSQLRYTLIIVVSLSAWFLVLLFFPFDSSTTSRPLQNPNKSTDNATENSERNTPKSSAATCDESVSVYVYELPAHFNLGLLNHCSQLNVYTNMCPHVANRGLGQALSGMDFTGSSPNWFATHQFLAEMIFHARMENHPCRTPDPTRADLFYVPFYGGLHASSKFSEVNHTARDELAVRLVEYLQSQPSWQRHHGKDHFLALGRTAWDFMRTDGGPDFGANCLLNLPPVQNMSVLTVERQPWHGFNQHGIPYPSYFHPSTSHEMLTWQHKMRKSNRPYLFSFIGAPRKGVDKAEIRNEFIRQCNESTLCQLVLCGSGASKCHEPIEVLRVMAESQFCLQAPGDSFTRRSTFDSALAGCIPVFFSPHTAYTQYAWYFPEETSEYSVYMEENSIRNGSKRIEEELTKISGDRVKRMRSTIIDLIPTLTYANPNGSDVGFRDAVDVALAALAKRFHSGNSELGASY